MKDDVVKYNQKKEEIEDSIFVTYIFLAFVNFLFGCVYFAIYAHQDYAEIILPYVMVLHLFAICSIGVIQSKFKNQLEDLTQNALSYYKSEINYAEEAKNTLVDSSQQCDPEPVVIDRDYFMV